MRTSAAKIERAAVEKYFRPLLSPDLSILSNLAYKSTEFNEKPKPEIARLATLLYLKFGLRRFRDAKDST